MSPPRVGVVIAEHELLVREGLERVAEEAPGLRLLASTGDLPTLREAVRAHAPGLVVAAAELPEQEDGSVLQLASELRRARMQTGVLVLTSQIDPDYATSLFEHGATGRGYVLKQRLGDREKLLEAMQAVAEGGLYLDTKLMQELLERSGGQQPTALSSLTRREHEILGLMAEGKSNARIARDLVVTSRAVERHVGSIFAKLQLGDSPDVSRRVMAVLSYLGEPAAR